MTALDGDNALDRIEITSRATGKSEWVRTKRLFVAIGGLPNTEWAAETAIIRDPGGYLVTGPDLLSEGKPPTCWPMERLPYYLETSVPGSFAAGDVRHRSIKRVATPVGEGAWQWPSYTVTSRRRTDQTRDSVPETRPVAR